MKSSIQSNNNYSLVRAENLPLLQCAVVFVYIIMPNTIKQGSLNEYKLQSLL